MHTTTTCPTTTAKTWYYPSKGSGVIRAYAWQPRGEVKAIVQFVHGIAEHSARYDDYAAALNEQGILVVSEDHMGHGGSIGDGGRQGYFHGGWLTAAADTYALLRSTRDQYPGVPYFLYGHSMGSFLARTILWQYPDSGITGAILSGTAWQPPLILKLGLAVCRREAKKRGETVVSPTVCKLMFGSYNKGFADVRTPHDWLSRERDVVARYEADPLCGFDATIGLSRDMLQGIGMIQQPENLAKMDKSLPVLFLAGDQDPVGAKGKGVQQAYAAFRQAGMQDLTLQLYPDGRHEMHNETNKAQVYADVIRWIFARI